MRTFGLLVVATLVAFVLLASGCGLGGHSEGQLGHASFAWQECFLGCSVTDNPMAAGGAHAEISVSLANGYSFNQVRSSNQSVATAAVGGSNGLDLVVDSGAPGQTQLQLIDAAGKLVDQVTITVTQTAKLAITQGWVGAAPLVLEGSTQTFHVTTDDANGHTLVGTGSVTFELTGPLQHADSIVFGDSYAFSGSAGVGHGHRARRGDLAGAADHRRAARRAHRRHRHGAAEHERLDRRLCQRRRRRQHDDGRGVRRAVRLDHRQSIGGRAVAVGGDARERGQDEHEAQARQRRHLQRHVHHRRRFDHRQPAPLDILSRARRKVAKGRVARRSLWRRAGGHP